MPKYRMTVDINAEQFLPEKDQIPAAVTSDGPRNPSKDPRAAWIVRTPEGMTYVRSGQYVIEKGDGTHYIMDQEPFEATYKSVNGE